MASGKEVLEYAFRETAKGNGRPFVDMLADDVEWSIIGSTEWSETFRGKSSVIADLLGPLAEQFDGPNTVEATRFIAEGDYPNRYCWIFQMRDGKAVRVT